MGAWLASVVAVCLGSYAAAYGLGVWRRHRGNATAWKVGAGWVSLMVAWYALSWGARQYAERDLPLWVLAEWWAHVGKWYAFMVLVAGGAGFGTAWEMQCAGWRRKAGVILSLGLTAGVGGWRTMPAYWLTSEPPRRDSSGFIRQSTAFTCVPATLANFLEHCAGHKRESEREMTRITGTTVEGTTSRGLLRGVRQRGLVVESYGRMGEKELEVANLPALLTISTLPDVHHAVLFLHFEGEKVHMIDPDYGYQVMTRDWLRDVWYGRTLILSWK